MGGACSRHEREKRCLQGFGGEPDRRRQLGRPRHSWEDSIEMDLHEVGLEAWTGLIWLKTGAGSWLL
jgi:hypothetical protein